MSALTENDLQALKDFIGKQFQEVNAKFQEVNTKIDRLSEEIKVEIATLKGDVKSIEARLDEWRPAIAKIPDLAEKVGELKKIGDKLPLSLLLPLLALVGWFAREAVSDPKT